MGLLWVTEYGKQPAGRRSMNSYSPAHRIPSHMTWDNRQSLGWLIYDLPNEVEQGCAFWVFQNHNLTFRPPFPTKTAIFWPIATGLIFARKLCNGNTLPCNRHRSAHESCIVNRQIGVGDSKYVYVIVIAHPCTGHVIVRMHSGSNCSQCIPMGDIMSHYSRTDKRRSFKLSGWVDHWSRLKGQRSRSLFAPENHVIAKLSPINDP